MKLLRWNILAIILAGFAGTSALAGPNAGGALIFHTDDSIVYTPDDNYVGMSGRNCLDDFNCPDNPDMACEIQSSNPTSGKGKGEMAVWWILAAFPEGSCPRLSGLTMGIGWDAPSNNIIFEAWGPCSDGLELPTPDWPQEFVGAGTAVTWLSARRTRLTEVYWFAGYAYYGPIQLRIQGHPTQGADFADDSVPSQLDPITPDRMGVLGLGGAKGFNPYPAGTTTGACCVEDACIIVSEAECASHNGAYQGDDTKCEPDPCAVPAVPISWGGLKFKHR
jgi:hypothetical protein